MLVIGPVGRTLVGTLVGCVLLSVEGSFFGPVGRGLFGTLVGCVLLSVDGSLFGPVGRRLFGAFVGFTKFQARGLRWPLRLLGTMDAGHWR